MVSFSTNVFLKELYFYFFNPHLRTCLLVLERGRGEREREKERKDGRKDGRKEGKEGKEGKEER